MLPTIQNRQRSLPIDTPALRRLCICLYALACDDTAAKRRRAGRRTADDKRPPFDIKNLETVTLVICGDSLISRVHAAVFSDPSTTDVITIPYEATPLSGPSAEIFVNARLARDIGNGLRQNETQPAGSACADTAAAQLELALYIAHGFDHLAGWDDHSPGGRTAMRKRELSWLEICNKQ